jgi:hypothetical protein
MARGAIFEFVVVLFPYILITYAPRDYIYVSIEIISENACETLQSLILLVVILNSSPVFIPFLVS